MIWILDMEFKSITFFALKKKNPLTITLRDINNIFINEKSMVILQTNYLK